MALQSIIEQYGYAAILIGTFLEGETILQPVSRRLHPCLRRHSGTAGDR
jgi:hypothetical protein